MYYKDDDEDELMCPMCDSKHVQSFQTTAVKQKGFGIGKAALGGLLLGPVGLAAGFIGMNKVKSMDTKVKLKCLKCGYTWEVGDEYGGHYE